MHGSSASGCEKFSDDSFLLNNLTTLGSTLTLNQLRTFLAVAEHESVHGAAQELVVTQAAVSASLAALQKALGLALVTRDGRGLRLTDAGRAYAGYVRRIPGLLGCRPATGTR